MSEQWNPTKKELEDWLDQKLHEFLAKENRNLQILKEGWLDCYIYTKIHEIFFATFLIELYKWIVRLVDNAGRCRLYQPIVWTPELVHKLEASKDKITRAIDHWLDRLIGGFIIDFAIDTTVSYSEAERCFL